MLFLSALTIDAPVVGAVVAFVGVVIGLWINGDRAERQRRRDLHARALAAVLAYGEMPFMVRRRRREEAEASAERVRLSDALSSIKAEMTTCQVLLGADGDRRVADGYDQLVSIARATAGQDANHAWNDRSVQSDSEMNMAEHSRNLEPFRDELARFQVVLTRATLPRRRRVRLWLKGQTSVDPVGTVPACLAGQHGHDRGNGCPGRGVRCASARRGPGG